MFLFKHGERQSVPTLKCEHWQQQQPPKVATSLSQALEELDLFWTDCRGISAGPEQASVCFSVVHLCTIRRRACRISRPRRVMSGLPSLFQKGKTFRQHWLKASMNFAVHLPPRVLAYVAAELDSFQQTVRTSLVRNHFIRRHPEIVALPPHSLCPISASHTRASVCPRYRPSHCSHRPHAMRISESFRICHSCRHPRSHHLHCFATPPHCRRFVRTRSDTIPRAPFPRRPRPCCHLAVILQPAKTSRQLPHHHAGFRDQFVARPAKRAARAKTVQHPSVRKAIKTFRITEPLWLNSHATTFYSQTPMYHRRANFVAHLQPTWNLN